MSLELINPKALQAVCGEDTSILKELIDLFLEQSPLQLKAIEEALEAASCNTLKTTAHTLKGSASYMGAQAVLKLASEIEQQAANNNLEACKPLLAELKITLSHTQAALKHFSL